MNKQLIKIITVVFLFSVSTGIVGAHAHSNKSLSGGPITIFEVKFDFRIGKKKFLKGKYKLSKLKNSILILDNLSGKQSKVLLGRRSDRKAQESLISVLSFNRYGDTYFLREIVSPVLSAKVGPSKYEKSFRYSKKIRLAKVRVNGHK